MEDFHKGVLKFEFLLSHSSSSLFVDPPFLFVDEDWPVEKSLPVVICSRGTSDVRIISGNEQGYFLIVPINSTCATLQLNKALDADIEHSEGQRWQSFSFVFEGRRHSRMSLEIQVVDVNDNAPEFVNTPARISLPETTPVGTLVTKVKTFDPDTGIGGIVQFFVENSKFSIENGSCSRAYCSAEIYLKSPLNYDSVKTEVLTVVARDGASRSKSSKDNRFNITVDVVDEQNTAPFFVSDLSREFTVKADSPIGERIFQIEAEDGDRFHADKNPIAYSLERNTYFEITPSSGWIVLSKSLKDRTTDVFKLTITATETDSNRMSTQGMLKIRIVDVDHFAPKCEKTSYNFEFNAETGQMLSGEKMKVIDEDTVETFRKFAVELKGRSSNAFELSSNSVSGKAELRLALIDGNKLTDYEKLELILKVPSKTQSDGRCDISVRLTRPSSALIASLPFLLVFNVTENAPPGVIGNLKTSLTSVDDVKFEMITDEWKDLFDLSQDGTLRSLKPFDREEKDFYSLVVKVESSTGAKSNINVDVRILDENDNAPEFVMDKNEFVVIEETLSTVQINAIDPDFIENGTITYAITSNTCPECSINSKTGLITIEPMDADSLANLTIPVTITATDSGSPLRTNTTKITLFVEDLNDNFPKFVKHEYEFTLRKPLGLEEEVGVVDAIDEDITGSEVVYTTNDEYFQVNTTTGRISLRKTTPRSVKFHSFEIKATDSGVPPKSSNVTVNVHNNAQKEPILEVERVVSIGKQNIGQIVYTPENSDRDNYEYSYVGQNGDAGVVSIDRRNGSITLNRLGTSDNFDADIEIRRLGEEELLKKEHLIFNVSKSEPPLFERSQYSTSIHENTPPGFTLLSVKARGDIFEYSIMTEPPGMLKISDFGDVMLARNVDFEKTKFINGTITAQNTDEEFSTTQIFVDVVDENDNSPICKKNLAISVPQSIHVGTVLDLPTPLCQDDDVKEHGKLHYEISEANEFFSINASSSAVTLVKDLPLRSVKFSVRVSDNPNGDNSNVVEVPIVVNVLVNNTHSPEFEAFGTITISQNTPEGSVIHLFKAVDEEEDEIQFSMEADQNLPVVLETNGELRVAQDARLEPGSLCFNVTATDSGSPLLATTSEFCLNVVDNLRVKMEPAILWPAPNSVHRYIENKKFDELLEINATVSPLFRGEDRSLKFSLVEQGEDWKGFSIDWEGRLGHNAPFNFEEKQKYEIRIEVCDVESRCAQLNLIIEVLDANDNCPFFQQQSSMFEIEENVAVSEAGLVVGEFPAAVDLDNFPEHRSICYALLTTFSYFLPNKTIPVLYLNQSLDREIVEQIQLTVRAHDCNDETSPCVDPNFNPSRADHIIIINVLDRNDNFPRFSKRVYQFGSIVGQVRPGDKIAVITATDLDLEKDGLRYSLNGAVKTSDTVVERSPFAINENTGEIIASMSFNGDVAKSYTFHMGVIDGAGHTDETMVIISVLTYSHQAELLLRVDEDTAKKEKERIVGLVSNASSFQVVVDSITNKQEITHFLVHFLDRENSLASVLDALATMNSSWSETAVNARNVLKKDFGLFDIRILEAQRPTLAILRSLAPLTLGSLAALLILMIVIIAMCCRQSSAKQNLPRRVPSLGPTYYNSKKTAAPVPRRGSQRSNAQAAWTEDLPNPVAFTGATGAAAAAERPAAGGTTVAKYLIPGS
ncbi:hypothetical protein L596_005650 [Steinernema carpocapsae]|uniref:Cadherin domain-containing protein n=1 Tax=Steinernema carpocapsae TaxID=34508 RepID=A0A4V6I8Q3_STECR|nr:hypothetical protein L596_005650 [Steinernema carpocapsae]